MIPKVPPCRNKLDDMVGVTDELDMYRKHEGTDVHVFLPLSVGRADATWETHGVLDNFWNKFDHQIHFP